MHKAQVSSSFSKLPTAKRKIRSTQKIPNITTACCKEKDKISTMRSNASTSRLAQSQMMSLFFLLSAILLILPTTISALQCGTRLTTPCRSATDRRYSSTASNDLLLQNPTWSNFTGYWIQRYRYYNPDGTLRQPSLHSTVNNFGFPYKRDEFVAFVNFTIVGTKMYRHGYLIYEPIPRDQAVEFCSQPLPANFVNVLGNGTCGVTGYASENEFFGTSGYEKDGTAHLFWSNMGPPYNSAGPGLPNSKAYLVGDNTAYYHAGSPDTLVFGWTDVMANEEKTEMGGSSTSSRPALKFSDTSDHDALTDLVTEPLISNLLYTSTKLTEEEWIAGIEEAYEMANVPIADRIAVPMTSDCLSRIEDGCPTEEDYCSELGKDPECTASPYQEPPAAIKPGPLAGLIILGLILLILLFFAIHKYLAKRQAQRLRRVFAAQVAQHVDLRGSVSQLPPDKLAQEFRRIDRGLRESTAGTADGYITREELWEFLSTGKAGELSEKDFNALFDAMDVQKRGKVNFVEFCSYLSDCSKEIKEVQKSQEGMGPRHDRRGSADDRLMAASVKISALKASELME